MNLMGQRIREKRLEKGLSLEALGKILGVQRAAVSKWELGAVENISQTKIKEMAKLFQCSPSWLMGYDEEKTTNPEELEKALELYDQYKHAIPQVQDAVEALLKSSRPAP